MTAGKITILGGLVVVIITSSFNITAFVLMQNTLICVPAVTDDDARSNHVSHSIAVIVT